LFSGEDG